MHSPSNPENFDVSETRNKSEGQSDSRKASRESGAQNEPEEPQISDIFLKTDIHGLAEFYQASTLAQKLCWALILIGAVALLVFEIVVLVGEYQNNPILTTYSIVSEAEGLTMPTVYLCPMSSIHQDQRRKVNVPRTWERERNVTELFHASGLADTANKDSTSDFAGILNTKRKIWDKLGVLGAKDEDPCYKFSPSETERPEYIPEDVEDYFMKVGYPIDTFFKECAFATESFNCSDVVQEVFDRNYGKCFLLKNENFVQRLPGIGLSLVLNLDTERAYSFVPPLFDGVVVKVENEFDLAGYKKLLLHPGQYSIISLQAKKYNLIERDRPIGGAQRCTDPESGEKDLRVLNSAYTLGVCRMDCMQSAIMEDCGCVLPMSKQHIKTTLFEASKLRTDPFCSFETTRSCACPLMFRAKEETEFRKCYKKCHVPCEYWEYGTEISFARFPSLMLLNPSEFGEHDTKSRRKRQAPTTTSSPTTRIFEAYQDYEEYQYSESSKEQAEIARGHKTVLEDICRKKNTFSVQDWQDFVVLDISFSNLQYTEVSQENSITFSRFVSDVGGQVGLWLGASMVSMIKIFVVTGPLFWWGFTDRRKKVALEINNKIVRGRLKKISQKH